MAKQQLMKTLEKRFVVGKNGIIDVISNTILVPTNLLEELKCVLASKHKNFAHIKAVFINGHQIAGFEFLDIFMNYVYVKKAVSLSAFEDDKYAADDIQIIGDDFSISLDWSLSYEDCSEGGENPYWEFSQDLEYHSSYNWESFSDEYDDFYY